MAKTTNTKIQTEIARIERALSTIEKFRATQPAGSLNKLKTKAGIRYRQKIYNNDGTYSIEYLKRKDKRIKALAHKKYFKMLRPVIMEELNALRVQEKHYHPEAKYEVYNNLGDLKEYVEPLFYDDETVKKSMIKRNIESWIASGVSSGFYDERKNIVTDDGSKVRSKSEALIYNQLLQKGDRLKFKYENELYLKGGARPIRPDFEIISLVTGEIFYWEHVGMLGYEEYSNDFVKKINNYYMAGIYPGEKLILTFETGEVPINTVVVKRLIDRYFPPIQ